MRDLEICRVDVKLFLNNRSIVHFLSFFVNVEFFIISKTFLYQKK